MISIVIPLFNEQDNVLQYDTLLFPLIDDIAERYCESVEYVLIDDGSSDNTLQNLYALKKARDNIHVYAHELNRGMGAAIKTGIRESKGDLIITMDSDLTYRPEEVEKLLKCYYETKADCIYGSPYGKGGVVQGVSKVRLIPSLGVTLLYQIVLFQRVSCMSAIIRLYRLDSVRKINIESDGFDSLAEILAKMIFSGMVVKEVPVTLYNRSLGESKLSVRKELLANIRLLLKLIKIRLNNSV